MHARYKLFLGFKRSMARDGSQLLGLVTVYVVVARDLLYRLVQSILSRVYLDKEGVLKFAVVLAGGTHTQSVFILAE